MMKFELNGKKFWGDRSGIERKVRDYMGTVGIKLHGVTRCDKFVGKTFVGEVSLDINEWQPVDRIRVLLTEKVCKSILFEVYYASCGWLCGTYDDVYKKLLKHLKTFDIHIKSSTLAVVGCCIKPIYVYLDTIYIADCNDPIDFIERIYEEAVNQLMEN